MDACIFEQLRAGTCYIAVTSSQLAPLAVVDGSLDLPRIGRSLHRRSREAGRLRRPQSILLIRQVVACHITRNDDGGKTCRQTQPAMIDKIETTSTTRRGPVM